MAKENGGVIGVLNTPSTTTASGIWALQDQYEAKRNGNWPRPPFLGTNSLRFNGGSSDYLNRTPASASNRQIFTFSFWIKRSRLGYEQYLYCTSPSNAQTQIIFSGGDVFGFDHYTTGYTTQVRSTQVFRDASAWYHLMVAVDTTQATASNRVKLYVNGSQITDLSSSTYPSQNFEYSVNNTVVQNIGRWIPGPDNYFSGYLSEYNLIDGQQLTPSSFGASNASGVWYPIPYSGSYGTNGFNLQFGNSASLGTDSSPNGNNWTVNNLTSIDQTTDTELNNFCTWNSLDINAMTLTDGNLTAGSTGATWKSTRGTFGISQGKWYWEVKATASGSGYDAAVGVGLFTLPIASFGEWFAANPSVVYSAGGNKAVNGTETAYGATWTVGDIIGVAFDADNLTVTFYKNGTSQGTITTGWSANTYAVEICLYGRAGGTTSASANFGSPAYSANGFADGNGYGNFSYAVPSGYYALCTANLNTYG